MNYHRQYQAGTNFLFFLHRLEMTSGQHLTSWFEGLQYEER